VRAGLPRPRPRGRVRPRRPAGAGHFVKMVHKRDRVRLMQAYAEGFEICPRPPSSTSTSMRSPPSGATARSCGPGCWSWPSGPSGRSRASTRSRPWWPIRARAAGRSRRPSSGACRLPSSPRPCSPVSPPRSRTPSDSAWCRRCATSSAARLHHHRGHPGRRRDPDVSIDPESIAAAMDAERDPGSATRARGRQAAHAAARPLEGPDRWPW